MLFTTDINDKSIFSINQLYWIFVVVVMTGVGGGGGGGGQGVVCFLTTVMLNIWPSQP